VGGIGGTYAGNPLACAAALGVFRALEQDDLLARARRIETLARGQLEPLLHDTTIVWDVRGRGAMIAFELADADGTARPELARQVMATALSHGVLVLVCGTHGNVVRLLPPLVIEDDLLSAVLVDAVRAADETARAA